ncbi:hypothetical protein C0J52_24750 [Blattella germanica]|nr:hypothetical protein C0J52_24750 [Blattella germanica]
MDGSLVPACLTEANTFWSSFFFIMIISVFFLLPLCITMLYLNSAVNPILYNLMSSKFRDGFMRLCGLRRNELALIRRGTTSTTVYSSTRRCNSLRMTQRNSPTYSWRSASRYSPAASPNSERRHKSSFRRSVIIRTRAHLWTSPILGIANYRHDVYFDGSKVAVCLTQADTFWTALFFILSIAVFFAFPLFILVILYTIIARHLMTHPGIMAPASRNQGDNSSPHHSVLRYRKQVVLMLGTVVLSFFVCLMPFRAFTLWIIVAPQEAVFSLNMETYYNILYFCRVMTYLNSAINPILYNIMSSKFRDGFIRLCGLRHKPNNDILLGRKGTFNTTSTTTTTTCSSNFQDSIWRRSIRNALSDDGKLRRTLSIHAGDNNGNNNARASCQLLRSKSHVTCSVRNNVVCSKSSDGSKRQEESYV